MFLGETRFQQIISQLSDTLIKSYWPTLVLSHRQNILILLMIIDHDHDDHDGPFYPISLQTSGECDDC